MVRSEVEEVHLSEVEEISNIKTPILVDMDKILATTNQVMAINSNNIRCHSSIKLHLDPMSILHLVECKLRPTHNLRFLNVYSKTHMLLDKLINNLTEISVIPTHHLEVNVHENRLSVTRTEDIP